MMIDMAEIEKDYVASNRPVDGKRKQHTFPEGNPRIQPPCETNLPPS
jgi:hypothetical protein